MKIEPFGFTERSCMNRVVCVSCLKFRGMGRFTNLPNIFLQVQTNTISSFSFYMSIKLQIDEQTWNRIQHIRIPALYRSRRHGTFLPTYVQLHDLLLPTMKSEDIHRNGKVVTFVPPSIEIVPGIRDRPEFESYELNVDEVEPPCVVVTKNPFKGGGVVPDANRKRPQIPIHTSPEKKTKEDQGPFPPTTHQIEQRQKQIEIGKSTSEYRNYISQIPKSRRQGSREPDTPNVRRVCSKRAWDGLVHQWRRLLHQWDGSEEQKARDVQREQVPSTERQSNDVYEDDEEEEGDEDEAIRSQAIALANILNAEGFAGKL